MAQLLIGTLLLAFVHAFIPNHWLPLVAIAKTENWEKVELMIVASLTASAHVLGTVLLGIALGLVGSKLAHEYEIYVHLIAPVLLILLGLIYFSINMSHRHHSGNGYVRDSKRFKARWIVIFAGMMFLSPCLEVESLFLAAGPFGLNNVLLLAMGYAAISILSIVSLVFLAHKGIKMINSHFIEHYEKRITGLVLIFVGVITFFIH